ncbi:MAG: CpsB/CapC family capsule biosynthesis tyrosine phosphatase [Bacteroidota bacterium]
MLNLFKRKSRVADLSSLGVDMHAHWLPGIDDGAQNLEESVELILGLKKLGYRKLIATPHIYSEYYPNTKATIQDAYDRLRKHLEEKGIEIELEAAAEYFMDEQFEELLQNNQLLTFGDNYVLVEMSFYSEIPKLQQYIFQLCAKGYRPILAHPERYIYYAREFEKYQQFKERGCLLQVNLLSLTGHYGKPVQQLAQRMLKDNLVDFLGTDMHKVSHLDKLKEAFGHPKLQKWVEQKIYLNASL